jgi:hypothetical protein
LPQCKESTEALLYFHFYIQVFVGLFILVADIRSASGCSVLEKQSFGNDELQGNNVAVESYLFFITHTLF